MFNDEILFPKIIIRGVLMGSMAFDIDFEERIRIHYLEI